MAKRAGESGIQRQLSLFFKSPHHATGEAPIHDLFKQEQLLLEWARDASRRVRANGHKRIHALGANGSRAIETER